MKLDRNTNPDGRGKYALIQMREISAQQVKDLRADLKRNATAEYQQLTAIPCAAIHLGGKPREQFFVLKYKDRFASAALYAYAEAVLHYANNNQMTEQEHADLVEYSEEIGREAYTASHVGTEIPT